LPLTETVSEHQKLKRDRLINLSLRSLLILLPLAFMGLFFYAPLVAVFQRLIEGFTESGLGRANAGAYLWRVLSFTIWQATLSTLLTLLIGLPAAYVFARLKFAGKGILIILITLPFILPTVVTSAAFTALLGPSGWVNQILMSLFNFSRPPITFLNTFGAILIAHVFYNVAIIIRIVGTRLAQLDPKLEGAARTLGASPMRAFLEVTLPLLRPAILSAVLLVFLFDFASFGVVLMLGGPQFATLEVEIYTQTLHLFNLPLAAVLSALQLGCTLLLTIVYTHIQKGQSIPLMPRFNDEISHTPRNPGEKWLMWITLGILMALIILPMVALVFKSVTISSSIDSLRFTFDFYRELFINRRGSLFYVPPVEAIRNSLYYGVVTTMISLTFGTLISYALQRRGYLKRWFETLVMLPLGSSPVTLGLGFILIFNKPPLDVRTFPLLVPIAHSLVALPMVVRAIQPALQSIPRGLRESAAVLGASPLRRWIEVDIPILTRAAVVAGVFSFTISLGEFGATTFLSRPEMPTIPTAIFRFLSQPGIMNYGQAMAMSVILLLICAVSIFMIQRFQR